MSSAVRTWLLPVLAAVAAFAIVLPHEVLWSDESYTLLYTSGLTKRAAGETLATHTGRVLTFAQYRDILLTPEIARADSALGGLKRVTDTFIEEDTQHVPLYYWVAHSLRDWFGFSVFDLRVFNALLIALTVLTLSLCFQSTLPIVMVALSSVVVHQCDQIREYAMVELIGALALFMYMRYRRTGRRADLTGHFALMLVGALTSVFNLLLFIPFWIDAVFLQKNGKFWPRATRWTLAYLAASLPNLLWYILYYPVGIAGKDSSSWVAELGTDRGRWAYRILGGFGHHILDLDLYNSPSAVVGGIFLLAALVIAVTELRKRSSLTVLALLFLVPLATMISADLILGWGLTAVNRFWIFSSTCGLLLIALKIDQLPKLVRAGAFTAILLTQIFSLVHFARLPTENRRLTPHGLGYARLEVAKPDTALVVGIPSAIMASSSLAFSPELQGHVILLDEKSGSLAVSSEFKRFVLARQPEWVEVQFASDKFNRTAISDDIVIFERK